MTHTPRTVRSPDRWFTVIDGVRLQQLRRQHGLSPAELAQTAGVGLPTVLRLERQPRSSCGTRTAARLATALNQPAAALTCGQPSPGHAAR
ncbi:MAG: helix-turn-helix domain-containing protein [Streptosporangiaceae bacterium]